MTARPEARVLPRARPRAGAPGWSPALLRFGSSRPEVWQPVLLRRRRPTPLTLLFAFLALQFLIPARLVIGGLGAVGRPSVVVAVGLALLWIFALVRPRRLPAWPQPIRWLVLAFVAVQLFGYAVGYDRGLPTVEANSADRWLIFMVAMAGVALTIADGLRTRAELDRLLRLLVGFAAVMSVVGMLQFFGVVDLTQYIRIPGLSLNSSSLVVISSRGDANFARVASTANHYIEFGVVLALILPLAVHYATFAPTPNAKLVRWGLAGLVGTAIPLSISRSAILTVVVTMGLLAVVWPWRHRYNAMVVGVLAVGAFHTVNRGVLGTIRALFVNAEHDPSVQNRIADMAYVFNLWAQRPVVGRGAGTVMPERYILLDNEFYVTLLGGGIVGVTALVLLFLVPYAVARSIRLRAASEETRHLGQALAVTMPAAMLASFTFDSFSFATFVGVLFVLIGATGALWRLERMSVRRPLRAAAPGDRFVATPLMLKVGAWLRRANRPAAETTA